MKLILFFSRGISLLTWQNSGLLYRELAIYKRMLSYLESISFITYGKKSEESFVKDIDGLDVLYNKWRLPTDFFSLLSSLIYRNRICNADVIKTNQINGWWAGGLAKLLYCRPLVVRCGYLLSLDQERKGYGRLRRYLVSILEKYAFKYADASIVTTPQIKEEIIRRYGIASDKIHIIPNPVDIDLFRPMPEIERVRGRLCFVGRLTPEKNIELLLEALSGIKNASILIIGDGELKSYLKSRSVRMGINAHFLGNIPNNELPELLNTCQAFVLQSKWEGMPKVLIEAMACGMPVVGTNVSGIRDLIDHEQTGILCEPEIESLRDAIRKVLNNSQLCKDIGRQARDFVANNFSLKECVSKELDLLTTLINR